MVGSDKAIVLDDCMSVEIFPSNVLTDIDESARRPLAEHLWLVWECDLDHPGDVTGRGLHPDSVTGDQLGPDQHRAEHHLEPVKEVVADDDHGAAARGPALARGDRLDAGDGRRGIQTGV